MKTFILVLLSVILVQSQVLTVRGPGKIIKHTAYSLMYSENDEQAAWVAYELTQEEASYKRKRKDSFKQDKKISTGSASVNDYKGSGYDKGHLAPAGDMKLTEKIMSESFFMSNMNPQAPRFNRGIWKQLESQVRTWVVNDGTLHVITGPILDKIECKTIGFNYVSIPDYYYKAVVMVNDSVNKGIGFIMPNRKCKNRVKDYVVSIDTIEAILKMDLFYELEDSIENKIESVLDTLLWQWPER